MTDVKDIDGAWRESHIHAWFGLTYSSYLVLQRSVMEAMPLEWQERMVALLNDVESTVDTSKCFPGSFMVRARSRGRFIADPFADYRRPPEIPMRRKEEP